MRHIEIPEHHHLTAELIHRSFMLEGQRAQGAAIARDRARQEYERCEEDLQSALVELERNRLGALRTLARLILGDGAPPESALLDLELKTKRIRVTMPPKEESCTSTTSSSTPESPAPSQESPPAGGAGAPEVGGL